MRLRRKKQAAVRSPQYGPVQRPSNYAYRAQRNVRSDDEVDMARRTSAPSTLKSRSGWPLSIAVLAGTGLLLFVSTLSSSPRVVYVGQTNQHALHSTQEYQAAAEQDLSSSVLSKSKITVNTKEMAQRLQARYPELASVSISLPLLGHRPVYHLELRQPAFVVESVNGSYVMADSGLIIGTKDAAPAALVASLPVITDQTGQPAKPGGYVISPASATFTATLLKLLAAKQLTVSRLTLPAGAAQEIDVNFAGKAYFVKFNTHDPDTVRTQVGTYLAVAGQGVAPAQYIDVRVPGRAYYQ